MRIHRPDHDAVSYLRFLLRDANLSRHSLSLIVLGLLVFAAASNVSELTAQELEGDEALAPLDGFDEYVERVMEKWHIPGAVVGVIHDGKVAYVKAFGHRRPDRKTPITIDTLFPIASVTKSFTATGVGILVDDEKLKWDDRVTTYLPEFELHDKYAGAHATIRDLLIHRTGVPSYELSWLWGTQQWLDEHVTRRDVMRRLKHVKPTLGFRENYQYSNEMYAVLGLLFEAVDHQTWEEFTQQRILDPLGMNDTYLHLRDVPETADVSPGNYFHYGERSDRQDPYQGRALSSAGTIVSNVPDMLRWVRFQIRRGRWQDGRLLSADSAHELIRPQIPLADVNPPHHIGGFYGMGFMIFGESERKKWVQHSGKLSDCTAMIGFIPAQRDGFVILTNWSDGLGYSPLQVIAANLSDRFFQREVNDHIDFFHSIDAREWERIRADQLARAKTRLNDTRPSHPLHHYTGEYHHPVFQSVEVYKRDDRLHCRFHGRNSELAHYQSDQFTIRIGFANYHATFHTNEAEEIDRLTMNLESAVDDIEFVRSNQ